MKEKEIYLVRRIWTGKNRIYRDTLMGRIDPKCSLCKQFTKTKELDNGNIILYYTANREQALELAQSDWKDLASHFGECGVFSVNFLDLYPIYNTEDIKLEIKYARIKETLYEPKTL